MKIIPEFSLTFINAFYFIIPIILIRYLLPGLIRKDALHRVGYFPPLLGNENIGQSVYTITFNLLFFYPLFLSLKIGSPWFSIGLLVYIAGIVGYFFATADFSRSSPHSPSTQGFYRFSRNPMYVAFFLVLVGVGIMTASWIYLLICLVMQWGVHKLIISEERWCLEKFGEEYARYMKMVRRYF